MLSHSFCIFGVGNLSGFVCRRIWGTVLHDVTAECIIMNTFVVKNRLLGIDLFLKSPYCYNSFVKTSTGIFVLCVDLKACYILEIVYHYLPDKKLINKVLEVWKYKQ